MPVESSATRVSAAIICGGASGTNASKGGREPGNCREPTTIPPDVSLSSITRTPKRDLMTFLWSKTKIHMIIIFGREAIGKSKEKNVWKEVEQKKKDGRICVWVRWVLSVEFSLC